MMSHMSISHRHLTTPNTRTNIRHPVIIPDPLMLVIRISLPSLRSVEHDLPLSLPVRTNQRTTTTRFPMGEALDTAQPVVEYLPGWHCDITAARKWEDLPQQARDYVEYLEKAVGCKITYISVGAEREAYIHRG